VELKYCPDTDPLLILQTAAAQHAGTIPRLPALSLEVEHDLLDSLLFEHARNSLAHVFLPAKQDAH